MIKNNTVGAYTAPMMKNVCVRCEEGFAQSVTIDGLTPMGGVWDEDTSGAL